MRAIGRYCHRRSSRRSPGSQTRSVRTCQGLRPRRAIDIAIRLASYQAQWIRQHRWHPTQVIEEHENGALTLKMKVGALDAIKRLVIGFGSEAQVIEPQGLGRCKSPEQ
ncbi:MAG: WYL domain-containing protein [Chlorobiales bacterium]|nr:WYL domain-containing protein [Chlorobiales bacterium]